MSRTRINRPNRPRSQVGEDPFALPTAMPTIPAPIRRQRSTTADPEPQWDLTTFDAEPPVAPRRVLVVEDDPRVASLLERALRREGYDVDCAFTGVEALACGLENTYSAILVDLMIPAPDGVAVIRRLRRSGQWAPVLVLTARDGVEDRINGLHAGADDYLTKPFSVAEVLARVFALTRRGNEPPPVLRVGDLFLDPLTGRVARGDVPILLCAREFDLLLALMRHPGHILTRAFLRAHALPGRLGGGDTALAEQVDRLRERIDVPFGRHSVQSVGTDGYRIVDDRAAG
jgi:two-component system OmpR family response regulator